MKKNNEESKEVKSSKQKIEKYAPFIKRLGAYVIDVLIIGFIASLICMPFVNEENIEKLEDEFLVNSKAFFNKELDVKSYQDIQISYSYNIAKEEGLISIVTILISIVYFGLLQFYMKGQTYGKKLFKICVKSDDDNLSINQLLFRALIIDSIVLDLVLFVCMLFMNKTIYYYSDLLFESIQFIIYFVCFVMIIKNNDRKGLHDVLFHTSVIDL